MCDRYQQWLFLHAAKRNTPCFLVLRLSLAVPRSKRSTWAFAVLPQHDLTYREAYYDKDLDRLSLLMIELLCKRLSLTGGERRYQIPSEFAEGV